MSARTKNLFESAVSRARVIRQGDIVQVVIDGGGAFVTFTQEFRMAQKWASSRIATGNMVTDRGRFFEQIGTLVSRPGSMVSTRGSGKYVENLVRAMNQGGYELSEWMLTPELKAIARAHLQGPEPKVRDAAEEAPSEAPEADDDVSPDVEAQPRDGAGRRSP
ncbi:hypothetical protein [Solimonas marina]|uniref:Uncharacterized protein n=1 Tax=Solimonas marina TaxID=2714601 RepID=A0A969WBJ2_9GAMM|nr:hypothetical protein [Solimonas marina]NKF22441.1 hypothetical protein [Solimonas marina]